MERNPYCQAIINWVMYFEKILRLLFFYITSSPIFPIAIGIGTLITLDIYGGQAHQADNLRLITKVADEFAIAAIVAGLVSLTIERILRAKQDKETMHKIEEIKENVFKAVYGKRIYGNFFSTFEREILKSDVFRKSLKISILIEKTEFKKIESDTVLKLAVSHESEIETSVDQITEHKFKSFVDGAIEKKYADKHKYTAFKLGKDDILQKLDIIKTNIGDLYCECDIIIDPKKPTKIFIQYEQTCYGRDHTIFTSIIPTTSTSCEVIFPTELTILKRQRYENETLTVGEITSVLKFDLDKPMMPNSSIDLWWFPKSLNS